MRPRRRHRTKANNPLRAHRSLGLKARALVAVEDTGLEAEAEAVEDTGPVEAEELYGAPDNGDALVLHAIPHQHTAVLEGFALYLSGLFRIVDSSILDLGCEFAIVV